MGIARFVLRMLIGLGFLVFGANYFLKFMDIPPPPTPIAGTYLGEVMVPTGYLTFVKVLEIVGGLLLVSGILVPLGTVILMPIIINILCYEMFLAKTPGPAVVFFVLTLLLMACDWRYYRPFFQPTKPI